jgi:hypothetical protein
MPTHIRKSGGVNIRQTNLARMCAVIDNAYDGIIWNGITECDWYSATFVGRRVVAELQLPCELARKSCKKPLYDIGELEFNLKDEFVADIHVIIADEQPHAGRLRIEALLINV